MVTKSRKNPIQSRRMSMAQKKMLAGFLFTLPAIIGVIWLFLIPMGKSLFTSFHHVEISLQSKSTEYTFMGFENYRTALARDPTFNQTLVESLVQMLTNVPIIVFFSFFAATLVNSKFPGRSIARFLFFLPLVTASASVMTLDSSDVFQQAMANTDFKSIDAGGFLQGLEVSELLQYSGRLEGLADFIMNAINGVFKIISLSGVQIIILLAALQSVPRSLYEMAIVEGATQWEIFWKITFVLISPMLLICLLYSIIDSFTAYDNMVLQAIEYQLYTAAGYGQGYGLAAAMSWIYFLVMAILLGAVGLIGSKLAFYYDKG